MGRVMKGKQQLWEILERYSNDFSEERYFILHIMISGLAKKDDKFINGLGFDLACEILGFHVEWWRDIYKRDSQSVSEECENYLLNVN